MGHVSRPFIPSSDVDTNCGIPGTTARRSTSSTSSGVKRSGTPRRTRSVLGRAGGRWRTGAISPRTTGIMFTSRSTKAASSMMSTPRHRGRQQSGGISALVVGHDVCSVLRIFTKQAFK